MIVVAGFLLVVMTVPLLGGRFSRLGALQFERGWLITLAMIIQIPITTFATDWLSNSMTAMVHLITYLFAFAFVWANRAQIGMAVLVVGAICNFAAIAANGGVMPASASALETAGLQTEEDFQNSGFVEDANLAFLGDIFAIPEGRPFANVFSIGDILLVLGGGYVIHRGSASILFPNRRRDAIVEEFWARFDAANGSPDEALNEPEVAEPVSA